MSTVVTMIYALAASVMMGLAAASNSYSAIFEAGNVDGMASSQHTTQLPEIKSILALIGYYQLRMVGGSAVYDWSLDLSNFTTSCDISQGLTCTQTAPANYMYPIRL